MRVMVLVKATKETEAGVMPKESELAAMGAFDEELVKAGVMPALARYPFLPSARADLLAKLGRTDEALLELERAASLTANDDERALLHALARALRDPSVS